LKVTSYAGDRLSSLLKEQNNVEDKAKKINQNLEEADSYTQKNVKRTIYFTLGLILLGIILIVFFANKFKSR
jgi:hypothetical protein